MKRFILCAVIIILSAFTACENDMFNDAFSDNKSSVKYYGYVTTTSSLYSYEVLEDGSFQQIGAPVTGLTLPRRIAVHPSGDNIYVAVKNSILCYKVGDNGALTPLTPLINTIDNENMAVHPSGKYLYAINTADSLYTYNITQDGSLVYNSKTIDTGTNIFNRGIAVSPSGSWVYGSKAIDGSQYICYYEVENNGKLNYINRLVAANVVQNVIIHPSGNYLYCATSSSLMSMNILQDGSLTIINDLSGAGSSDIILHPLNKYLYGTNQGASYTFSNFGIMNNGALLKISVNSDISSSTKNCIAVHPNGKYVYFADRSTNSSLISFTADSAGSLAYNTMTAKTAELPFDIKIVSKTVFGNNK